MKPTRLTIVILTTALTLAGMVHGDPDAQPNSESQERFNIYLKIAPEEGVEPVRHGQTLSWQYEVALVVSGTGDDSTRTMPPVRLLAGEKATRSAEYGKHRIAFEVGIDPSGEKAAAVVEISRHKIPVYVQRFAVWLPPLPKESKPGPAR